MKGRDYHLFTQIGPQMARLNLPFLHNISARHTSQITVVKFSVLAPLPVLAEPLKRRNSIPVIASIARRECILIYVKLCSVHASHFSASKFQVS